MQKVYNFLSLLIVVVLSAQERTLLRTRQAQERVLLDQEETTIWGRLIEDSSMSYISRKGGKKLDKDISRRMERDGKNTR